MSTCCTYFSLSLFHLILRKNQHLSLCCSFKKKVNAHVTVYACQPAMMKWIGYNVFHSFYGFVYTCNFYCSPITWDVLILIISIKFRIMTKLIS
jgi:hypothetical protein